MSSSTPPKHKTPNYKLVGTPDSFTDAFGRNRTRILHRWVAQPLRPSRKDLRS